MHIIILCSVVPLTPPHNHTKCWAIVWDRDPLHQLNWTLIDWSWSWFKLCEKSLENLCIVTIIFTLASISGRKDMYFRGRYRSRLTMHSCTCAMEHLISSHSLQCCKKWVGLIHLVFKVLTNNHVCLCQWWRVQDDVEGRHWRPS